MKPRIQYVDALRLSREEVVLLLGRTGRAGRPSDERRCEPRIAHVGNPMVLVEIGHPGDTCGAYRAVSCNISSRGLGFLHGGFVYADSPCQVILINRDGKPERVAGRVVRCSMLEGRVHEVGMAFDDPIDVQQFLLDVEPTLAARDAEIDTTLRKAVEATPAEPDATSAA